MIQRQQGSRRDSTRGQTIGTRERELRPLAESRTAPASERSVKKMPAQIRRGTPEQSDRRTLPRRRTPGRRTPERSDSRTLPRRRTPERSDRRRLPERRTPERSGRRRSLVDGLLQRMRDFNLYRRDKGSQWGGFYDQKSRAKQFDTDRLPKEMTRRKRAAERGPSTSSREAGRSPFTNSREVERRKKEEARNRSIGYRRAERNQFTSSKK